MPFSHGYGVAVGPIEDYFRDDPDDFGRYYHTHIVVSTAAGAYQCAIDVDSHQSNTGVEWRTVGLTGTLRFRGPCVQGPPGVSARVEQHDLGPRFDIPAGHEG